MGGERLAISRGNDQSTALRNLASLWTCGEFCQTSFCRHIAPNNKKRFKNRLLGVEVKAVVKSISRARDAGWLLRCSPRVVLRPI